MHFTTYEKTSFPELAGRSFTNSFSGPKKFPDFRETGPWGLFLQTPETFRAYFGCNNSLYISVTPSFQAFNFTFLLFFLH